MWIPITVVAGSRRDLHIQVAPGAQVNDLADALARHLGRTDRIQLGTSRGPLNGASELVTAGVRAGATIYFIGGSDMPTGQSRSAARRQVRVIGGPDAGLVVPLPEHGTLSIGRDNESDVRLTATAASRRHAVIDCTPDALNLRDVGSANGTAVDGRPVNEPVTLTPAMIVQIGDDRLSIHLRTDSPPPQARLTPLPDGTQRLERQQRFTDPDTAVVLVAPAPPGEVARASGSLNIASLSGLAGGLVAFAVMHNPAFLLLSVASTGILMVSNGVAYIRQRRQRSRSGRDHTGAVAAFEIRVAEAMADESARRLREAPDPAETLGIAETPQVQLWQRRLTHDDFLRLRVGLADLPSEATVQDGGAPAPVTLRDVPLTVDLASEGTIGITGARQPARALARWLVAQAAVHSGPSDLRIVVLTRAGDRDAQDAWDWVRWLPHARADSDALASVAGDEESLNDRVEALATLIAQRQQMHRAGPDTAGRYRPQWLVLLDDLAEHDPVKLADVTNRGPDVGISVIAIGQTPYRCPVVVTFADEALTTVRRSGHPLVTEVLADQIGLAVAERIGRALAPLHDPQAASAAVGLPGQVSLLDLITLSALDPAALRASWQQAPRRTRVMVGETAAGPLFVDLVANGPHALIAGATGSGKSAMLQTIVASLAAANRPDELGFILVDFKGGAAFAPFNDLPHVLGTITNLDEHAVMRALSSLAGELRRRQRHLAAAGVEKIEEYHSLADTNALPPSCPQHLPRVFVVIDEFAMLKEGMPSELMDGLVHIATVGRSLGVHLILGTQAPRGVVPPQMRPNVNLKVAFRLDADHSQDVIGVPDAHLLAGSGRGYLRRGDEPELTLFQSAFVGGATRATPGTLVGVIEVGFSGLGHVPSPIGRTDSRDIDVLVGAVREAAALSQIAASIPPWLPDLPEVLPLQTLAAPDGSVVLHYGREDHPEDRAQPVAVWDLAGGTHLLAAGRPRSGRTTLLRTLAASAARYRPDEIHLYVMDCGGALGDLAALPQCGALVTHTELERGVRLLDALDEIVSAHERRRDPGAAPRDRSVLLIDDWDTWSQTYGEIDGGAVLAQLVRLFRKGPAAGLHIAVTGGSKLLTSSQTRPFTESAQDRIALPFDPDDYRWFGVPSTAIPGSPLPGRAVRLNAPYRSVQVGVVGDDAHAAAQARALRDLAGEATKRAGDAPHGGPIRVDALPEVLTVADARTLPRIARAEQRWIPLGAGGDRLQMLGIDLDAEGSAVFVAGDKRSGRSTALLAAGLDLLARGVGIVAITPNRTSVLRVLSGAAVLLEHRSPNRRMVQLALAAAEPPYVVLVDDAEQIAKGEAGAELRELLINPDDPWTGMIVATGLEDLANPVPGSFLAEVGRGGAGLILAPRQARPQLFGSFVRLPQAQVGIRVPGRAVLMQRSGMVPVQVPYAVADDATGLPPAAAGVPALLGRANTVAGEAPTTMEHLREVVRDLRRSAAGGPAA